MKNNKRFVTLFENTNNEILMKDVGLIPYYLGKNGYYDVSVATCKCDLDYSYIDSYVKGLHLDFFTPVFGSNWLGAVWYTMRNALRIDILNLYHLKLQTFVLYSIYKLINRDGKVYLKLDIDKRAIEKKDGFIQKTVYKLFLKKVDFCSCESQEMVDSVYKKYGTRPRLIFNGYYDYGLQVNVDKKENLFLTVGRLGTIQKNTECLLEAFRLSADKHTWKLELVGSVEKEFDDYIDDYFKKNPELKERIIFKGKIVDKKELFSHYERAKVFVLPSRWESSGLVLQEAMNGGDYLVGTNTIPPLKTLINEGSYGRIVKVGDSVELANVLSELTKHDFKKEDILSEISFAKSNFEWGRICNQIYEGIEKLV